MMPRRETRQQTIFGDYTPSLPGEDNRRPYCRMGRNSYCPPAVEETKLVETFYGYEGRERGDRAGDCTRGQAPDQKHGAQVPLRPAHP